MPRVLDGRGIMFDCFVIFCRYDPHSILYSFTNNLIVKHANDT